MKTSIIIIALLLLSTGIIVESREIAIESIEKAKNNDTLIGIIKRILINPEYLILSDYEKISILTIIYDTIKAEYNRENLNKK